ncbi:MAG: ATP-binding protein [Pseudomonadota bacterium]
MHTTGFGNGGYDRLELLAGHTEYIRQASLLKTGALQDAIFNSAYFSSIGTDERGVIQIFNVGAERMLGYKALDVVNRITPADISDPLELIARAATLSEELDTPIAPGFDALVFKASRGIEDIYELTYIRQDGSRFPAIVSVTALRNAHDDIIGYLLIGTDNTTRKRFERALEDKNIELEHASRMKSEFLATMSHELRTPFNAIIAIVREKAAAQHIGLELDMGEELGIVQLDVRKTKQIVYNLLSNAVKFSASGGPVQLRARRVRRDAVGTLEGDWPMHRFPLADNEYSDFVEICVSDHGIGISQVNMGRLFQAFSQIDSSLARKFEGTGLGLAMVKQLAELQGGAVAVASAERKGARFAVWLPLRAAPHLADLAYIAKPLGYRQLHAMIDALLPLGSKA